MRIYRYLGLYLREEVNGVVEDGRLEEKQEDGIPSSHWDHLRNTEIIENHFPIVFSCRLLVHSFDSLLKVVA